jgi:hypothetical protein
MQMTEKEILLADEDRKTSQADFQAVELPPGWNAPRPEKLPRPTYWPVVMALGVVLVSWGIVTTLAISGVGLSLIAVALGGWIVELRNER